MAVVVDWLETTGLITMPNENRNLFQTPVVKLRVVGQGDLVLDDIKKLLGVATRAGGGTAFCATGFRTRRICHRQDAICTA